MSHLPWQSVYQAHGIGGDEQIEALQTDVMRFMAILGLCLMAIFSLVQSLPYKAPAPAPKLESKELLETEIQQLQKNGAKLLEKIQHLENQVEQKQKQIEKANHAEKQQFQDSNNQVAQLKNKINTQRGRLGQLNKTLQQEQIALDSVRKKLTEEQQLNKNLQQQLQKTPLKKVIKPLVQQTRKKGFSLQFSSEQALLNLIKKQQIKLYILKGKHAWQINQKAGFWKMNPTKIHKQYYQMAAQTVPDILKQVAKEQLSIHNKNSVIWAVMLPQTIASKIAQIMKNRQAGDLVIAENGQVQVR